MFDAAETLAHLNVPSGNRLERVTGDRAGQHSIQISRQ
jgi:toxin HigB-1